jgi:hypothetical protein
MKQHLFFCLRTAFENKEDRHPQIVMRELSEKLNFNILGSLPQTAFGGWEFWMEYNTIPKLPKYLSLHPWTEVGSA